MSKLRKRAMTPTPSAAASWRTIKHQTSLGSDFVKIEPSGSWPTKLNCLEFEIPNNKVFKFNTKSFFEVSAVLKRYVSETPASGGDPVLHWRPCELVTDWDQFVLAPNWFDFLIKKIDLVCGNETVSAHNIPPNVLPLVNTLLYNYMDKNVKALVASNPAHPAHCMPQPSTSSEKWKDYYTLLVASQNGFKFQWIPLNVFPFSQNLNHCLNGPQQLLPTGHFEKMYIRIYFVEDFNIIFKHKVDADKANYKLELTNMNLWLEEEKLSPSVHIPKGKLSFPGHSLSCQYETIPAGETVFKTRFLKTAMPQQLVILAIDKSILPGQFDYRDAVLDETHQYLKKSNLKSINLIYNGHEIASKVPNFQYFNAGFLSTCILKDTLEKNGLLSMKVDPTHITYANCQDEFGNTPFPFNVVDYTLQDGTQSRVYPSYVSAVNNIYSHNEAIEINLNFYPSGAPANVVFLFILMYFGKALQYEVPRNQFVNMFSNLKTA